MWQGSMYIVVTIQVLCHLGVGMMVSYIDMGVAPCVFVKAKHACNLVVGIVMLDYA